MIDILIVSGGGDRGAFGAGFLKGWLKVPAQHPLAKPEFDVRKHYMMTMESRGHVIATTSFWLLGKGANYSGKVEFSDSEAKQH